MNILQKAKNFFSSQSINKFNQSFYWGSQSYTNDDDPNTSKYIEQGYNINSDVYSIVNQISNKVAAIPYSIKEIDNKQANTQRKKLLKAANNSPTFTQKVKLLRLEMKALKEDSFDFPLERPNPNQTWDEFWKLSITFLKLTGNVYWYKVSPKDGMNAGSPKVVYVLPSHLMEIVLKDNANILLDEDVVKGYLLTSNGSFMEFENEDVIHVKYPNPNFGMSGQHLYGQSPLRAAWKNLVSSNKAMDLNINTLKNGGVFGFIHSKGAAPLSDDQAIAIKSRLKEMNSDTSDLSRIAGSSAELGFTRLSLTTDELKPFDYLKYDQKSLCNVFGWSDTLLNNDDGGKYDKQIQESKRVVTNTIVPDLNLLLNPFNKEILQRFKGYDNREIEFDIRELPEMQEDMTALVQWLSSANNTGFVTKNESRVMMGMETISDKNMDIITVKDDIMTLEDAILPPDTGFTLNE